MAGAKLVQILVDEEALVQIVPSSSGKYIALAWVVLGALSVRPRLLVAFLNTTEPLVTLAVPRVRLEPATVAVPVKLAELEIVWPLIKPDVRVPDIVALLFTVSAVPAAVKVLAWSL